MTASPQKWQKSYQHSYTSGKLTYGYIPPFVGCMSYWKRWIPIVMFGYWRVGIPYKGTSPYDPKLEIYIIRKIIIDPKQMLAGGGYVGLPGEIAFVYSFL